MAFWNRNREERAAPTSGLALPSGWLTDALTTSSTPSGKRVNVQNALGLAPVWAAVSIIAEQIGQLPLKVYREVDGDRVEARQHRAWRLLHDRPNEITPAGRFWSTVAVQLLLWGNAFIEKRRDSLGLVDELWLLNPAQVKVKWDPNTRVKTFEFQPTDGRPKQDFSTDDVLHIFGVSLDGLIGLSVISQCRTALGSALARDEFEGGFYKRGAVLSGIVTVPGTVKSPDALQRLATAVRALFSGSERAHDVGVFEDGSEFKPLGSPMKDLEFVAAQQLTRTDIAVMFKLPPNYLGGSSGDGLTYATVEMNQAHFALHAVAPWTTVISSALTQDPSIMPQSIFDCEFVLEGMLRGVAKDRAEFYKTMREIKAITPDEVRQRENLPPLTQAQIDQMNPAPVVPAVPEVNGNGNGAPPFVSSPT